MGSMETQLRPSRVFLVDDSPAIRERLVEQLSDLAHIELVGQAETPEAAIADILVSQPDYVVLDLNLRGGSGMTVLREVHAKAPSSVFAVLTNHSASQYRQACLAFGARYFFDKSSEFQKIRDVVCGLDPDAAQA
jgi:DNA-binding NarL/FixJ family response regulator